MCMYMYTYICNMLSRVFMISNVTQGMGFYILIKLCHCTCFWPDATKDCDSVLHFHIYDLVSFQFFLSVQVLVFGFLYFILFIYPFTHLQFLVIIYSFSHFNPCSLHTPLPANNFKKYKKTKPKNKHI